MLAKTLVLCLALVAFNVAAEDKPDEFAHHHWTLKDAKPAASQHAGPFVESSPTPVYAPGVKPMVSATTEDLEMQGVTPAPAATARESSTLDQRIFNSAPAAEQGFPKIAVCRMGGRSPAGARHSQMVRQYLISDSDGVDACEQFGGEIVAGTEHDRSLTNVKEQLKKRR